MLKIYLKSANSSRKKECSLSYEAQAKAKSRKMHHMNSVHEIMFIDMLTWFVETLV